VRSEALSAEVSCDDKLQAFHRPQWDEKFTRRTTTLKGRLVDPETLANMHSFLTPYITYSGLW
jgi:hypothetical protein